MENETINDNLVLELMGLNPALMYLDDYKQEIAKRLAFNEVVNTQAAYLYGQTTEITTDQSEIA